MSDLPKIGEKCWHRRTVGESFREGECVGHDGCLAIIRDKEYGTYTGCCGYQLRPIKSESDEQIEEMIKIGAGNIYATVDNYASAYVDVIKRLHKAGYRLEEKTNE